MASKWWFKGLLLETCNCAHGCACNLTARPTYGNCRAIVGFKVKEGRYGDTVLDGVDFVLCADWPGAIHKGNGKGCVIVSDKASPAQLEAISAIATGQAGEGGPFAIFASTYSETAKVLTGPVSMESGVRRASIDAGKYGHAKIGPIISDMDGSEADVHMVIPNGFQWRDGVIVNTEEATLNVDGLSYSYKNSSAFIADCAYNC